MEVLERIQSKQDEAALTDVRKNGNFIILNTRTIAHIMQYSVTKSPLTLGNCHRITALKKAEHRNNERPSLEHPSTMYPHFFVHHILIIAAKLNKNKESIC